MKRKLYIKQLFGLVKYPPPRVDNSWYSMEGHNNSFIIHLHRINCDEEKEIEKERKRGKNVAGWI